MDRFDKSREKVNSRRNASLMFLTPIFFALLIVGGLYIVHLRPQAFPVSILVGLGELGNEDAVHGLEQIRDQHAIGSLIVALNSSNRWVRCGAVAALGEIRDFRAVEPLVAFMKDDVCLEGYDSANALGKIRDTRAVAPLIVKLQQKCSESAAEALGEIHDARAIEPLIACEEGTNGGGYSSSAHALVKIGKPAVEPLIASLHLPGTQAIRALGKIGDPRAIRPLIAKYRNSGGIREIDDAVTLALEEIGTPAENAMLDALKDPEIARRTLVYDFFIARKIPGSEDALIRAFNRSGDVIVAARIVKCGNAKLESAGATWLTRHGYVLTKGGYGIGLTSGPISKF